MPFTASGPWDAPLYRPDYKALAALIAGGAASLADLPPERRAWLAIVLRFAGGFPEPPPVPGVVEAPPAGQPAESPAGGPQ